MLQAMTFPTIPTSAHSYTELLQMRIDAYNAQPGTLTGYSCDKCRNKGYIAVLEDDYEVMQPCRCLKTRDTLRRIQLSGLEPLLRVCTFQNFQTEQPFQAHLLKSATDYLKEQHRWFFVGGQSGCGKTHICTAIVGGMIKRGLSVRYLVWRDVANELKTSLTDGSYTAQIKPYKESDVLYVDDLFKTNSASDVKSADVKLAFEILDYRYRNQMLTIISTEWMLSQLRQIDAATAGRIIQMANGYLFEIKTGQEKDYRLRR